MSTQLSQIAKKAKLDRTVRFTSLAHLLTPEFLTETWGMMNRRAASGIDGESTEQFESELKQRVEEICAQLRAGAYRAPPVRRVEIPKGPGKTGTRPLGIPTVADRLLQRAVARIPDSRRHQLWAIARGYLSWKYIYSRHGRPRWYNIGRADIGLAKARAEAAKLLVLVNESRSRPRASSSVRWGIIPTCFISSNSLRWSIWTT